MRTQIDFGTLLDKAKIIVGQDWSVEASKELRKISKRHNRALRRYGAAGANSRIGICRHLENRLVCSPASWMIHLILAAPTGQTECWDALKERAGLLARKSVSKDVATARTLSKPEGGQRVILMFSWNARAGQSLFRWMATARCGESSYEYVRKGRGREAAAGAALHAIKHKGVRWFVLADVKGFFPSCSREMAKHALPIRKALLDRFAFVSDDVTIKDNHNADKHSFEQAVRFGLPEGSMCSGIVASKILERVLDNIDAPLVLCHGDNILIGCKTEAEAHAKQTALASACEKHPNGPLLLKELEVVRLGAQMDFCGYRFKKRKTWHGGYGKAVPSEKAFVRLDRRLFRKLFFALEPDQSHLIDRHASKWASSFRHWKGRHIGAGLAAICVELEVVPLVRHAQRMASKMSFPSFSALNDYLFGSTSPFQPKSYQAGGFQKPPPKTSLNAIFDADSG